MYLQDAQTCLVCWVRVQCLAKAVLYGLACRDSCRACHLLGHLDSAYGCGILAIFGLGFARNFSAGNHVFWCLAFLVLLCELDVRHLVYKGEFWYLP